MENLSSMDSTRITSSWPSDFTTWASGSEEDKQDSWKLVRFIRHC
jgi:hypothetical protein